MSISFHQLHIFYTVAQKGTFSAAGHALHMTQPAVTMQIQTLEEHFGTKVFRRTPKMVELTDAGLTLLPYAQKIVELMTDTDKEMSKFTRQLKGKLELGTSLTVGEYVLPRLLGPFNREFPHITVSMKVMNTTQILEELLAHSLTFGIVEALIEHPDIKVEPILNDELKLVLPPDHELLKQDKITAKDLFRYPFIMREPGSGTRSVIEETLRSAGMNPNSLQVAMELGSTGAIKSSVEAGLGISIVSISTIKHETALGVLRVIELDDVRFTRCFYSICLRAALLPLPAVTFMTFIQNKELSQWLA
ncbi:MAG: LysR family transcriptional regulator [Gorillibacterium sp.]|nr:LysR family transcriptional regulator [Gorillibacterium sp.]